MLKESEHLLPLKVLVYQVVNSQLSEWCASCLDYGIAAWDQDSSEALLKLCDKIEVEESIRRDGLRVEYPDGVSHEILANQFTPNEPVSGDVAMTFASNKSEEFNLNSFSPDLIDFMNLCSRRGLRIRKTDQIFSSEVTDV